MPPSDKDAVAGNCDGVEELKASSSSKKSDPPPEDALSDEDRELKERLETCVATVIRKNSTNTAEGFNATTTDDDDIALRAQALTVLVTELRTATASMTSVPKPLKFLRPHYGALKEYYTSNTDAESNSSMDASLTNNNKNTNINIDNAALALRARLADVMAVLAMTMGKPDGTCACL